jgi:RNA polymerase sigma-70 factor, ECF subfamily
MESVGYYDVVGDDPEQKREASGNRSVSFFGRLRRFRSRRRNDDEDALRSAYDAHAGELFGFALRSLGDRGLAEEVTQETFVRAWRSREKFDERRGSLRTWLFSIARNLIVDSVRARNVRPAKAAGGEAHDEPEKTEAADEKSLRGMLIADAMERLSEDHRVVIREIYLRDRRYDDVAEELGVPSGTLRSRTYYALKSLRLALEEMGWPDE